MALIQEDKGVFVEKNATPEVGPEFHLFKRMDDFGGF